MQLLLTSSSYSSTPGDSQSLDKRVAAGQLIKRYYFQLTEGCGDPNCNNENCASSKKIQALSPNQAAAQVFFSNNNLKAGVSFLIIYCRLWIYLPVKEGCVLALTKMNYQTHCFLKLHLQAVVL